MSITCFIKSFVNVIPPIADTNLGKGSRKARGITYFGITTAEVAIKIYV